MTDNEPSIPTHPEELSAEWLTTALRSGGVLRDSRVTSFETQRIGEGWGFTGRIARVTLQYDRDESSAPPTAIVKFPVFTGETASAYQAAQSKDSAAHRRLVERCHREMLFYREIAEQSDVPTPQLYFAQSDPDTDQPALLLEDFPDSSSGDALHGCTVDQAELVIRHLARFHVANWNSPTLEQLPWLPQWGIEPNEAQPRHNQRVPIFLKRFSDRLPEDSIKLIERLRPAYGQVIAALREPSNTLIHADCHLDNILFNASQDYRPVIFLDWQTVSRGNPAIDVIGFLAGAITGDNHAAAEKSLLELYHSSLHANGVTDYRFDEFTRDFRLAILWLFGATINWLAIVDQDVPQGRERSLIERVLGDRYIFDMVVNHNAIDAMQM